MIINIGGRTPEADREVRRQERAIISAIVNTLTQKGKWNTLTITPAEANDWHVIIEPYKNQILKRFSAP